MMVDGLHEAEDLLPGLSACDNQPAHPGQAGWQGVRKFYAAFFRHQPRPKSPRPKRERVTGSETGLGGVPPSEAR